MSPTEQNFISAVEKIFWETGKIPSPDSLSEYLGVPINRVSNLLKSDTVRGALLSRGVDLSELELADGILTPAQLALANMLLNFHDKKSHLEKIELVSKAFPVANLTPQKYHAWLRQPAFSNYLRRRAEAQFSAGISDAYLNVLENVQDGDLNAAKFMLELSGVYNPKLTVDVDVPRVITAVLETVVRHVRDKDVLLAISADLERILPGGSVGAPVEVVGVVKEIESGGGFGGFSDSF